MTPTPSSTAVDPAFVVVLAAANNWAEVRMADHQLATALSRLVPVVFVDPPRSLRGMFRRTQTPADVPAGVTLVRPYGLPGIRKRVPAFLNRYLIAGQIRRELRAHSDRVIVVQGDMASPVIGRLRAQRRVYWAQDDWQGMAPLIGVDPRLLAAAEQHVLAVSDLVIAANPVVAASTRARTTAPTHLLPFGCNVALFTEARTPTPAADVPTEERTAVVMGTLNDRLDFDLLEAVADRDVRLLLVGPRSADKSAARLDRLLLRHNVVWTGGRSFESMPSYLAHASVGLVPYTHSIFNEGSFPLKTLEYLAAGLPVVASDLPAIRWLASADVAVADGPTTFADLTETRAALGRPIATDRQRRADFAATHSWPIRAQQFLDLMTAPRETERRA